MDFYTESQLKRAFECGCDAGIAFEQDKKIELTAEMMATPQWVHNTNMQLLLWRSVKWADALTWILKPNTETMQETASRKKQSSVAEGGNVNG